MYLPQWSLSLGTDAAGTKALMSPNSRRPQDPASEQARLYSDWLALVHRWLFHISNVTPKRENRILEEKDGKAIDFTYFPILLGTTRHCHLLSGCICSESIWNLRSGLKQPWLPPKTLAIQPGREDVRGGTVESAQVMEKVLWREGCWGLRWWTPSFPLEVAMSSYGISGSWEVCVRSLFCPS